VGCRRGHLVELGVAGGKAGHRAAVLGALLQHVEGLDQRAAHRGEVLAATAVALGNGEDFLFRLGQQFGGIAALRLEPVVDDAGTDIDQLSLDCLVADDIGVGLDVGRAGRAGGELDQVGATGDLLGLALRVEPVAHRHRIARLVLLHQFADRAIDQLVVAAVEIVLDELVGHPIEGVRIQHQTAQHRLFGFDRLRRHPQVLDHGVVAGMETGVGTGARSCAHRDVAPCDACMRIGWWCIGKADIVVAARPMPCR